MSSNFTLGRCRILLPYFQHPSKILPRVSPSLPSHPTPHLSLNMFFAPAIIALSAALMTATDDDIELQALFTSVNVSSQQENLDIPWVSASLVLAVALSLKPIVDLALLAHSRSSRIPIPSSLRRHWLFVTAFILPVVCATFMFLPADISEYLAHQFPATASLCSFVWKGLVDTTRYVYCFDMYGNLSRLHDLSSKARYVRCHETTNIFRSAENAVRVVIRLRCSG